MKKFQNIYLISHLILSISCSPNDPWIISESSDGLSIVEGTDSVMFYQKSVKSLDGEYGRSNYVHPLYDLNGNVITEDFPEDHYHQRGVFWTWHQIFVGEKRLGDGWLCENIEWNVSEVKADTYPDSCVVSTEVFWQSSNWIDESGNQVPFVKENAEIVVHTKNENFRIIDFHIRIESLVDDFYLGGSEDVKGYGGFSYRIKLPEDVFFEARTGKLKPQTLALELGDRVDLSGDISGMGTQQGILVMDHTSNPKYPQTWILRAKRSMQNVVFPGREPVHIPKEKPLILTYRMVIHNGAIDLEMEEILW